MIAEAVVQSKDNQLKSVKVSGGARPLRKISLPEYHLLIKQGFFRPEEKLELIEGFLFNMPPVYPHHATTVSLISKKLFKQIDDRAEVRIQQPITLQMLQSEPEPDFLIAEGNALAYVERHPYPDEVLLIGEVSDSTLNYDRTTKASLYALAGIQEYWIANVQDKQLEVYRDPEVSTDGVRGSYRTKLTFDLDDVTAPQAFPDVEILLKEIFPY